MDLSIDASYCEETLKTRHILLYKYSIVSCLVHFGKESNKKKKKKKTKKIISVAEDFKS